MAKLESTAPISRQSLARDSGSDQLAVDIAMSRGVRAPVAALMALIDSLEQGEARATSSVLCAARSHLARLERCVETLYAYSAPRPIQPLACSVEEIVRGTLQALVPDARSAVCLAIEDGANELLVDGPLLSQSLAYLIEDALARGSKEVLVHSHQDTELTSFAVVDDLADTADPGDPTGQSEDDCQEPQEGARLGLAVAGRDLGRMQGTLSIHHPTASHRCAIVRIPHSSGGV